MAGLKNEFRVRDSFKNSSILITGATGFVGKVLVENLLHDVKEINKIFILIRCKRGKTVAERSVEFKNSEPFRRVRAECPEAFNKLIFVEYNVNDPACFGINDIIQKNLRNEVNFVFHLAATVKFDEPVDVAVRTNLIATQKLVEMAKKFENLKAFLYVSTAYSNLHMASIVIGEKVYPSDFKWQEVINLVERGSKDELATLEKNLAKHFPNTYTFSKNLTENYIQEVSPTLPIMILRPSIVGHTIEAPFNGWVDFKGTVMGVQMGVFYGVLRRVCCNPETAFNLVHCDFVTRAAIVATARMAHENDKSLKIYNCTPTACEKSFLTVKKVALDNAREVCPSEKTVIYPRLYHHTNYLSFLIHAFLFEVFPSALFDTIMWIFTRDFRMTKLQWKIFRNMKQYEYFFFNQLKFSFPNYLKLLELLNKEDR